MVVWFSSDFLFGSLDFKALFRDFIGLPAVDDLVGDAHDGSGAEVDAGDGVLPNVTISGVVAFFGVRLLLTPFTGDGVLNTKSVLRLSERSGLLDPALEVDGIGLSKTLLLLPDEAPAAEEEAREVEVVANENVEVFGLCSILEASAAMAT